MVYGMSVLDFEESLHPRHVAGPVAIALGMFYRVVHQVDWL